MVIAQYRTGFQWTKHNDNFWRKYSFIVLPSINDRIGKEMTDRVEGVTICGLGNSECGFPTVIMEDV